MRYELGKTLSQIVDATGQHEERLGDKDGAQVPREADNEEIIHWGYLVFECSCQMSRTSEKQVEITRNNNACSQWSCILKADEWQQERISPLKDANVGGGKERESKMTKRAEGDGERRRDREDIPTGHGTIIHRINGMRFWNFVLFVRPVISIDESRSRHWFLLRVFYGDIFRRLTRVIFQ
ncbi:hypothetical protein WN48_09390 [Eufriesea mexicana]|nr:hypothetical protein WN48_09390 [Eufriesea mexicana]